MKLRFTLLVSLIVALACGESTQNPLATERQPADVAGTLASSLGVSGAVTGNAAVQIFAPTGTGVRRLTFQAQRKPDGSVSGGWTIVVGATYLQGTIDCLEFLPGGNHARMSGIVDKAFFTTFVTGTAFALEVVDNGSNRTAEPDETTDLLAFRNAPPEVGREFCETGAAPPGVELMEIIRGNFQVHTDE